MKTFSITTLYKAGDIVIYKGQRYKFEPSENQNQKVKGIFPDEPLGEQMGWKKI